MRGDDIGTGDETVGPLDERAWRLVAYGGSAPATADLDAIEVTATFADGRIQGGTGCNRYVGSAEFEGEHLLITRVASTRRACPPPADEVERAFLVALDGVRSFHLGSDELELLGEDGSMLLRFSGRPPTALVGTGWRAVALNDGKEAVVSVVEGTIVSMLLAPDGDASGSGGCNRWAGRYELDDDRLRFGPLATTLMACEERVMDQETAFHAALGRVARWSIEGDRLELRSEDGALEVELTPDDASS